MYPCGWMRRVPTLQGTPLSPATARWLILAAGILAGILLARLLA